MEYKEEDWNLGIQQLIEKQSSNLDNYSTINEFINALKYLSEFYKTNNIQNLAECLNLLVVKTNREEIPVQSKNTFLELNIAQILIDIAFNEEKYPKICYENAFSCIENLIDSQNNRDENSSQFFKEIFEKANILTFLTQNLNSSFYSHVKRDISLIVSLLYKNKNLKPQIFQQIKEPLYKFINDLYEKPYNLDHNDLYTNITSLMYSTCLSNFSDADPFFFYNYVDFALTMKGKHDEFPCDNKFLLYILRNISRFPDILKGIYENERIIMLMNYSLTSQDIFQVGPTLNIVNDLMLNKYDLSQIFSLNSFLRLIDPGSKEDDEIIRMAAGAVKNFLDFDPIESQLSMTTTICNYFYPAYKETCFKTKEQLVDTVCCIVHKAPKQVLERMIRENVVRILTNFLEINSDDNLIIEILRSLILIFRSEPQIDKKNGNNIAVFHFEAENGIDIIRNLDSNTNPEVMELSKIFKDTFEAVQEMHEKNSPW